jgi:PAS domain-containing protein
MNESSLSEKKIRQDMEEWQVTFDAIPDLVSIIDRDFRLRAVNSAFTKSFKVKPEDLLGRNQGF